jgi:hypothetical protein
MKTLVQTFLAARRASTPLICIRTADPAATIKSIATAYNGDAPPILHWDIIRGIAGINKAGQSHASDAGGAEVVSPVEALIRATKLPDKSILFFANAHRVIGENGVSQAVWNLRDTYKSTLRTLVLLCPILELPCEISSDVLTLDEPLPTIEQLAEIAKDIYRSADLKLPDEETLTKATDATCGLAAFPAEQVLAMSLTKAGLDIEALWDRKRTQIEQTPGLSVWRGGETFADIGGCDNVKTFMSAVLSGNDPPRAIVFLDEIEKQFAGNGTDTSGVSTEMTGTLLTWMQDHQANGCIFIGPPGAAKSMVAKATGNSGGVPTIAFDLGAMKGSLVGESSARLRTSLKVVDAVSQNRTLFIGTCNSIGILPPELRRRFNMGTFFFDLPTGAERKAIWKVYLRKYKLKADAFPSDEGWTGAEIKTACDLAWRLKVSLIEAATYIVPVSRSAADQIERLREQANGRFISASYPGVYQKSHDSHAQQAATGRRLEVS